MKIKRVTMTRDSEQNYNFSVADGVSLTIFRRMTAILIESNMRWKVDQLFE